MLVLRRTGAVGDPERQRLVDRSDVLRVAMAQARRDECAAVAAVDREAFVAEHVDHQVAKDVRAFIGTERWIRRSTREAVPGQGADDDVEAWTAAQAVVGRVAEWADDAVHLDERARPAVQEQERKRSGVATGSV